MITPAAWSNQASGVFVRRLPGWLIRAVWTDPVGGRPRDQTTQVAVKAAGKSTCAEIAETTRADGALTCADHRVILIT
jgi:hypothetical protein